MQHLTLEALARLVDEVPEAHEEAHLTSCPACSDELEALRTQSETLRTLPALMPPPDAWPALSRRLRAAGLVRRPAGRRVEPALLRVAAALALFLAGGATGFLVRGPVDSPPTLAVADDADRPTHPALADGAAGAEPGSDRAGATGPEGSSQGAIPRDTEALFAEALDRYMQESATEAPDPAARLAALDNIVLTTAEALNESPGDPVINSYHLTAVAQRRELLRQLSTSRGEPVF